VINGNSDIVGRIEADKKVFNVHIKGIPLWELIRYTLFLHLEHQQGFVAKQKSLTISQKVKRFFRLAIYSNPLFSLSKADILVIRCSRKALFKGKRIDIYTAHIEDEAKGNIGIYETAYDSSADLERPHLYFFDFLSNAIARVALPFYRINKQKINALTAFIKPYVSDLDVQKLVAFEYLKFRIKYVLFATLLKIRKPKAVYFTNYIDKGALIAAAKKQNILTIEIQHGFTSPTLLLYHYPKGMSGQVLLFPDRYYYLNYDYILGCNLPIEDEKLKLLKSSYIKLKEKDGEQKHKGLKGKGILFISQHLLHHNFLQFFKDFVNACTAIKNDIKIYYKPHPNEYDMFSEQDLSFFSDVSQQVEFLTAEKTPYAYLSEVNYVAGVYSTFLLEAKEADKEVILMNIPGVEHFDELKKKYNLKLAACGQELFNFIADKS